MDTQENTSQHLVLIGELHERALRLLEKVRPCPIGSRRWEGEDITIGEMSGNIQVCIGDSLSEVYHWSRTAGTAIDTPRYSVDYRIERVRSVIRTLREYMVLDDLADA